MYKKNIHYAMRRDINGDLKSARLGVYNILLLHIKSTYFKSKQSYIFM